jgi:hypothetical protein
VVNVFSLASQAALEQLAILAEVVQQPGQPRLIGRAERRSILCGPFGDGLQMVGNSVSPAAIFARAMC